MFVRSLILLVMALAVQHAAAAGPQKFSIAVPDDGGLISLGVFDAKGKLVRILENLTPMENLTVGLNGLIMEWDGKDQAGTPVAAGKYFIRGWFVPGDLLVEGDAFHFNSWINSEGIPPVAAMDAIVPRAEGGFYLIGKEAGSNTPSYWSADNQAILGNTRTLPSGTIFLGGNSRTFVLGHAEGSQTSFYLPEDQKTTATLAFHVLAATGISGTLALLIDEGRTVQIVSESAPSSVQYQTGLAKPAKFLTHCAGGVLAASETEVWFSKSAPPVSIPIGDIENVASLAPGPEDSFWLTGRSSAGLVVVRNYELTGELLRELKLEGESAEPVIFSDGQGLSFFLLSRNDRKQILREYRAMEIPEVNAPEAPSDGSREWGIELVREIEDAGNFGFVNGVASAEGSSLDSLKIHLSESEFSSGVRALTLKSRISDSGVWLQAEDGLDLFAVWDKGIPNRLALSRGESPDSLKILIGQPAYAAGFSIAGLRRIVPLDAGEFEVSP